MAMANDYDAIVIGSGLGGLTAGALYARVGHPPCPHCGDLPPLRLSLDPKSLVKWLVRILILAAVGFFVKLVLLG